MGQDWKTLSLVVLGAAMAGWLMVRVLSGGSGPHEVRPPAVALGPAAAPTAESIAGTEEKPAAAVAAPARSAAVPVPPVGAEGDVALIARDLEALAQALARDQRVEDRVMPRINDALDVPGVTEYRRAPDFWEPAFASSGGAMR